MSRKNSDLEFGQNVVIKDQEIAKKAKDRENFLKVQAQRKYSKELIKTIAQRESDRQRNAFHKQTRGIDMSRNNKQINY